MILDAFTIGVLFGGFALLLGAIVTFGRRRVRHADGGLGVWIAAAGLGAVEVVSEISRLVPWVAVGGIVLLAVGGATFDRLPLRWSWVVFAPGAAALALTPMPGIEVQTRVALGVIALGACAAAADFEREHAGDGFALWLFPISALVPALLIDGGTEPGSAFAGASLVMVVNVIPRPRARLGGAGIAALVGAYLWVGVLLSANRAVRLATLVAGLGFLILEPVARNLGRLEARGKRRTGKRLQDSEAIIVATAVFGQAIIGFFAVRVTGHSRRSEYALLVLLAVMLIFTATARAFVPAPGRRRSDSARRSSRRGAWWSRLRVIGATTQHAGGHSSRHHGGRSRSSTSSDSGRSGSGHSRRHRSNRSRSGRHGRHGDGRDPV